MLELTATVILSHGETELTVDHVFTEYGGDKWFLFWTATSFDPAKTLVSGESFDDAYASYLISPHAAHLLLDAADVDPADENVTYNDNGDAVDAELVDGRPVIELKFSDNYLDRFIESYVETLLWSSTVDGEDGEPEHADARFDADDFADDARIEIADECRGFVLGELALLRELDMDAGQAGHDFALTRNHHGAGFWDRGLGEAGDVLTSAAHAYGSVDLYVGDDGDLYVA